MTGQPAPAAQRFTPASWAHSHTHQDPSERALRNAFAIGSSNLISKGLLFLWQIMLARLMGAEGYGIYGTIGALLAIGAVIPEFGTGLIVIRDVAARPRAAGRYLATTLSVQPLFAIVGYAFLLCTGFLLGYNEKIILLLSLAALGLLIDVFGNMAHNQLLAAERMSIPAVIGVSHVALMIAMTGAVLAVGGGLWALYIAILCAGTARSTAYWIALWRMNIQPAFPIEWSIARHLLVSGFPLAAAAFLSLAAVHVDKLLTTAMLGPRGTGFLTAANVIVFGVVELLSTPWLVATLPWMSRSFARGKTKTFNGLVERLAVLNLLFSLPLAVCVSLLAVPLARRIFGPTFSGTAVVLRILIWYSVVNMANGVLAQALMVKDRQRRLLAARASGVALNVVLALAWIPTMGISGAALAALLAELVVLTLFAAWVQMPRGRWGRLMSRVLRLGLSAVGLAAEILWLQQIHPLLALGVGLPLYILLILLSGVVQADDWRLLRRVLGTFSRAAVFWRRRAELVE